ncbi:MAG: 50S ribosomal protein L29 [Anaerolineales bacterium]
MKSSEIRALGSEEIISKLADAREELMKLRFQQVTGQLTDSSRLRIVRRDIARMETILREQTADEVEGEA